MTNHCVVCRKESGFDPVWPGLIRCRECGQGRADLEIESLDLKEIYSQSYFQGEEYVDYLRDRHVFEKQSQDRLRKVIRFKQSGNLIEIGCAYGFFLEAARKHFSVRGFDIAEGPVTYARNELGLDACCEDFKEISCFPQSADVAAMWDTIEHLPAPDFTTDAIAGALRPGGYLFLTTGDLDSLMARRRRGKWRLFHPPTHLHYFSKRTIGPFLRSSGLEVIRVSYPSMPRSVRQIAYSALQLGKARPSKLYNMISESRLADLSVRLNTFDIMMVVAQVSGAP
ncbi:MAG: class I SAM-dependent methyltransferase [Acidobacteriota bacterium]